MVQARTTIFVSTIALFLGSFLFLLPPVLAKNWTFYGTDKEGKHLYQKVEQGNQSPGIVKVWDELIYSPEGRAGYIEKRKLHKHPVVGFENVTYRMVLYELNCFSKRKEYVVLEVFEMDGDGRTLDYARAGSYKDWQDTPDGSVIDLLHHAVCPARRTLN
jgi:hypothetical protein